MLAYIIKNDISSIFLKVVIISYSGRGSKPFVAKTNPILNPSINPENTVKYITCFLNIIFSLSIKAAKGAEPVAIWKERAPDGSMPLIWFFGWSSFCN